MTGGIVGIAGLLLAVQAHAVAPPNAVAAEPPSRIEYEVRGEISSTTGGAPRVTRISTYEGVEATIKFGDGPRTIQLAALVRPSTQSGCHTALLTLTITKNVEAGKVLKQSIKGSTMHCGSSPVPFPGLDPNAALSSDLRVAVAVTSLAK